MGRALHIPGVAARLKACCVANTVPTPMLNSSDTQTDTVAKCKCFNTGHEHHKGKACTDTAEENGYCHRCNDARKKNFAKPVPAKNAPHPLH
jgi:hypothetical protein